ncbi:MAG: phosphatidylserine decarboxylase family protein [Bacteroidales bacterium]|nr:phosphatidylserine decarboxylase family protein [Bacteroidales bacterium]
MKIHIAGIIPILILLTGVLIILFLLNWFFPAQTFIHYILYAAGLIFMFLVVGFFRIPARKATLDSDAVYSGADGKVVAVEKVYVDEYFKDERIQVSVFMSTLNAHINWSPIGGKLIYRKHHHGKHLVAFSPKSSLVNEHTSLIIQDEKGREIMMRQIAGAVARRIICKPTKGYAIRQGEMVGMIKFGSRVDLLLPTNAEVQVNIGDKARGFQTIIAKIPQA